MFLLHAIFVDILDILYVYVGGFLFDQDNSLFIRYGTFKISVTQFDLGIVTLTMFSLRVVGVLFSPMVSGWVGGWVA